MTALPPDDNNFRLAPNSEEFCLQSGDEEKMKKNEASV